MMRDILRFLWRRDSDSAMCIVIHVAEYLSQGDRLQARNYLESLHEACKPRGVS